MLKRALTLLAVPLLLAQATCGGALTEPFTPPESGGAPWVEVTSKHIVLRTDLPADEARDACVEFERIYGMFEDVAFPYEPKPKAKTTIILFRRDAEYKAIAPRSSVGYFHRAHAIDDYFEPTAVFYGDLTAATRLTFQHELTHRFVDFYFPRAPVWLHEGMAEYFSTMLVEDKKVFLGRSMPNAFFIGGMIWAFDSTPMWPVIVGVPLGAAPKARELVEMDREAFYAARVEGSSPSEEEQMQKRQTANYTGAWALVHLFKNGPAPYPERFNVYLEKLAASVDPDDAFRAAFGAADDKLEGDYEAWLAPKDRIVLGAPYELPADVAVSERALDPADVHVLWASIRPWGSDANRARARADLDAAIRIDPRKVSARVSMAQLDEAEGRADEAEKHLKDALAASPDDPAATYALFRLLFRRALATSGGGDGRWERPDALLPKVLAMATSSRVQNGAARYLAARRRADEGLTLAVRAVRGDPSCWQCFDTLASLLAQKGAYEKAKEAQSVAVSLLPENVRSEGVMKRMKVYEEAARRAKGGGGAEPCAPGAHCAGQDAAPKPAAPGGASSE